MKCDTKNALASVGCDAALVERIEALEQQGCTQECLRLLRCQRCRLVNAMHEAQRPIDVIDWIIADFEQQSA